MTKKYPSQTPEKWKQYNQRWQAKNPDKARCLKKAASDRFRERNPHYQKEWVNKNKDKVLRSRERGRIRKALRRRWKKYGLTPEQFNIKNETQTGLCMLCNELNQNGRDLCVDHDHETGNVRDLLCTRCNRGLGMFKDSPELLEKAAAYIRGHKENVSDS
jgi:hypothetical protein